MTAIFSTLSFIAVAGDVSTRGEGHERTAQPRQVRTRLVRSTTDANRLVSHVIDPLLIDDLSDEEDDAFAAAVGP